MTATIPLEDTQATLQEVVEQLAPGEEIIITRNQQPVARLIAESPPKRKPRVPGNCQGMITLLVEDEEHLKDFEDYMP